VYGYGAFVPVDFEDSSASKSYMLYFHVRDIAIHIFFRVESKLGKVLIHLDKQSFGVCPQCFFDCKYLRFQFGN
jgi:hypothetical protein